MYKSSLHYLYLSLPFVRFYFYSKWHSERANMRFRFLRALPLIALFIPCALGSLRPQDSETRFSFALDGWWDFRLDARSEGLSRRWFSRPLVSSFGAQTSGPRETLDSVPVPASFNDLGTNASVRDYVGWFWYERTFYLPISLLEHRRVGRQHANNEPTSRTNEKQQGLMEAIGMQQDIGSSSRQEQRSDPIIRFCLRFESVHYFAKVWLNGVQVAEHESGHLPFEADVTHQLSPGNSPICLQLFYKLS